MKTAADAPSLLRQLLLWILLPLLPLFGLSAWQTHRSAREAADRAFDRTLQASARSIAERVTIEGGELVVDLPVAALEMFDPHFQDRVFYRVGFVGGRTLTGDDGFPAPDAIPAAQSPAFYDTRVANADVRAVAYVFPLYYGGANRRLMVQVGETTQSRRALAASLQRGTLAQQFFLALVVALFASIGIRRALRPLNQAGRRLQQGQHLDEASVQQELQPLIRTLNQALAQLERQLDVRQRFVADAAHQLRTPLTLLKTQAELALRQPDPAQQADAVSALARATDQTIRLANQLLTLSRVEPGHIAPQQPLDLAALAREVCARFVPFALGRGVDLGYEGEQALTLRGQPLALRELLDNLIDNAVRYTPAGGVVTVALYAGDDVVRLEVRDSGPGIAPAERERVFERFYRGRPDDGHGCGLGLSIVEEVAKSHDANIVLDEAAEGGLRVVVRFSQATD